MTRKNNLVTPIVGVNPGQPEGACIWYTATPGDQAVQLGDLLKEVYTWNVLTYAPVVSWQRHFTEARELDSETLPCLAPRKELTFSEQYSWYVLDDHDRVLFTFQFNVEDEMPELLVYYSATSAVHQKVLNAFVRENIGFTSLPKRIVQGHEVYSMSVNWTKDDALLHHMTRDRLKLPALAVIMLGTTHGAISPILRLFEIPDRKSVV